MSELFIPGATPVFLFVQREEDAHYLALLLSNHLQVFFSMQEERSLTIHDNYFQHPAMDRFRNLLAANASEAVLGPALQVLLDEGRDTKKWAGLCLSITDLPQMESLMTTRSFRAVFVYSDHEHPDASALPAHAAATAFAMSHAASCRVLHARFFMHHPHEVLKHLADFVGSEIVHAEKIQTQSQYQRDRLFRLNTTSPCLKTWLQRDTLLPCCPHLASSCMQLVFGPVHQLPDEYWHRLLLCIASYFIEAQQWLFLVDDQETAEGWSAFLKQTDPTLLSAEVMRVNTLQDSRLFERLAADKPSVVLVDDGSLQTDYTELLDHFFKQNGEVAMCGEVRLTKGWRTLKVMDLFLQEVPRHQLLFDRRHFPVPDSAWPLPYALWDAAIRWMTEFNGAVQTVAATLSDQKATLNQTVLTQTGSQGELSDSFSEPIREQATDAIEEGVYQQILQRHRDVLDQQLQDGIRFLMMDYAGSQLEQKRWIEKITRLESGSAHRAKELSALYRLNAQLQQRIHVLENNWYQQWRIRVSRIKKIFFKKNTPGKGTLARFLAFMRFSLSRAGLGLWRKWMTSLFRYLFLKFEKRPVEIIYQDQENRKGIYTYQDWLLSKTNLPNLQSSYQEEQGVYTSRPLLSLLMPVYNTPLKYLREAIESVLQQTYPNWELCICDDASTEKKVSRLLEVYSAKDARIRIHHRTVNGHISLASNDAWAMARGTHLVFMDHDDVLTPHALWEMVKKLHEQPDADIIYSDEDKMNDRHQYTEAHFKPQWSPDHLLSRNYMGHLVLFSQRLMQQTGGFRAGFEGSQDYDLLLRATELTQAIYHIPKVLYHWRIHAASAAQGEDAKPYAYIAARKALEEALVRRGLKGEVHYLPGLRGYRIDYALQKPERISILIPTKDHTALLKNTVNSLLHKTHYRHFEIIVLDNNSHTEAFHEWKQESLALYPDQLKVIDAHFPFNFSRLMNLGVQHSSGQHILMLNNDVEVIHPEWLDIMLSYTQQKRIGAVGVKLLYPDDTIQHAGVIVGLGGIAGHTFVGAYRDEAGYFNYIQSVNNYSAVTAACLMCRKDVFEEVGGMDERFEVEYNDVDFCLRIMQAGYHNVYLPQVELYHYESATRGHPHQSQASYARHLHEMKLFREAWADVIADDPHYNPNLNLGVHDFSMNFSA